MFSLPSFQSRRQDPDRSPTFRRKVPGSSALLEKQ